ncbi:ShlB/FhaC/HecB family hemolysin secretion/activation protein [Trinickia dinghuensis]|uniref:ShlB/FhaC/HecB family hemolysin secretion/activation protein n=1 Tax=Trinickia dinghuensis TaxID=2291023 RepID=A0A3D8K2X6_9BURK|nr:ShlB/FhaC/HecB family hemolysin secretion/activation protein [Trinickia dinghuensis]RDU99589.1 ShlB/FhaC/HecB family hemolysin secretion/activation protein [Trinickia dinghuensis]
MTRSTRGRLARRPLFAALVGALSPVAAHAAGPVIPNAGTMLQQSQPAVSPGPSANRPGLSIEQPAGSTLPSSMPFEVEHIQITGNSKIDTATLHALVASSEGKQLTLPELGALALRITDYYHAHGYPLARAIVPAQTLTGGVVRIEVIEARYGKIELDNHSRVGDALLQATLGGLQSGAVVTQAQMDRALLLLSDIPGLAVNATLKPGAAVGTSDLDVATSSASMVTGSVTADDYNNAYSGRPRLAATVSVLNPLHHGDELSVSGLTSGADMNYGRVGYDTLLNGEGTRLGASFSALDYRLGGSLSPLNAHGTAQVTSADVRQPLIRSRNLNVYAGLEYDHLSLDDEIGANGTATRRHLDNVTTTLSGDVRDAVLAGAVSVWSLSWTYGHVSFDNAAAQAVDASGASTQGGFSKWSLSATRLQDLGGGNALYLSISGQLASGNLDSSQQLVVGGPGSVRAYDVNAVSGDDGGVVTLELRHTMPQAWYGQWQAIAFVDAAHVSINRNGFEAGSNSANLGGAGVGVNWAGPHGTSVSASVATPVGARPVQAGSTSSVRGWVQLSKAF